MKFLYAEDHDLVRQLLAKRFEQTFPGVEVIQSADLDDALEQATQQSELDLVILDLVMPGMNGLEGLSRMIESRPDTPVVMLSGSQNPRQVTEALERGAAGYIPKTISDQALSSAIQLVLHGERFVPACLLADAQALEDGQTGDGADSFADPEEKLATLTAREAQVLALIAEGKSNKMVARELDVKEITVKVHLQGVYRKLGVNNRTQASTYFIASQPAVRSDGTYG